MKKITAIILLFLFLLANTGIAVTVHYCGGRLSSFNFFSFVKSPCKCGKKSMKKDCCKNKVSLCKMKENVAKTNLLTLKTFLQNHFIKVTNLNEIALGSLSNLAEFDFYPPPQFKKKSPINLFNRVFLI